MQDNDFPERSLVDRDTHDELDSAVRTLAEVIYEAGFPPERALDMAWACAQLPELMKRIEEEW